MKKPNLYTTPIIVATVMLILGLLGAFNLSYFPLFIDSWDGMDGGFALTVIGAFLIIAAVVIYVAYGKLNNDFRKMVDGETLLSFVLPPEIYATFSRKEAEDIKAGNKAVLLIITGFCVLFGLIFGIAVDPVFILICLGIAGFFTLIYFVITAARTSKVNRSQAIVYLNLGGVYIFGQLYSWSRRGSKPKQIDLIEGTPNLPCPYIQISYITPSYPAPRQQTVTIPVPSHLTGQAQQAVTIIRQAYGI